MSVTVRFFASLRERMGCEQQVLDPAGLDSVAAVWSRVSGGRPMPPNTLAAVNLDYVTPQHPVADGDEVAFFPPVTGG
jgi:molybdopterin synthase sulfur carrier subunit